MKQDSCCLPIFNGNDIARSRTVFFNGKCAVKVSDKEEINTLLIRLE